MRLATRTVPIPSLDAVKMEDRKRANPDDSAPPAKRQAVTVNGARSHPDADMPWKDDIEVRPFTPPLPSRTPSSTVANTRDPQAFQKDALVRQMREYKREKNTAEAQLTQLESRTKYHDDHLRTLDAWFDQVSTLPARAWNQC
jgi:E3 ubiquitin-protein ligase BRE1